MSEPAKVLVIDSDTLVRQGLAKLLGSHPDLEVVASARNVRTAEPKLNSYAPDLVVLDLSSDPAEAMALLARFEERHQALDVVGIACGPVDERAFVRAAGSGRLRFVRREAGCLSEREIGELNARVTAGLIELRGGPGHAPPKAPTAPAAAPQRAEPERRPATPPKAPVASAPPIPASSAPPAQPAPAERRVEPALRIERPTPRVAAPEEPPAPRPKEPRGEPAKVPPEPVPAGAAAPRPRVESRPKTQLPLVVGIGVSTGGPAALARLIPALPAAFPLPIVVVQHMPPGFTRSLADSLDSASALEVREAVAGDRLAPGLVLIAPGGHHMRVRRDGGPGQIELTLDPPVCSCRPSVDYLFRSLAAGYRGRVLGVVLTGMGEDGWAACRELHAAGACLLAQDQASCTVFGMPKGPIQEGLATAVGLQDMAQAIVDRARSPSCC